MSGNPIPVAQDAGAMARDMTAGCVTSEALTRAALERIAQSDGEIRAFITVLADEALAAAKASDKRRLDGRGHGPLDGIPVAVKDNIAVAGVVTTGGSRAFDVPATQDANAVARLRAAGAVLIGTLNMHEAALGATTDNPHWGQCINPLAPGLTPGGSSGGSAAAIAAGMVPLTLGTDTMGSVRIPAAYCGLWGLKPTAGRIGTGGLMPLSWTLDTIGPMARSAGDLASMLSVLQGPDPRDPAVARLPKQPSAPRALGDLVLGVPDVASIAECEPVVMESFLSLTRALEEAGATLRPVTVAGWEPGALRRSGLLLSEVEVAEALGDAIDNPGFSDGFRAMAYYGKNADSGRIARAYRHVRHLGIAANNTLFGLDGILMPTAPQRAFAHGTAAPSNQADFTALANIAGAPAISMPIAAVDGGLPCAAQIMGPVGSDHRLIVIGQIMQGLAPLLSWNKQQGERG